LTEEKKVKLKEIDIRVLAELMKNCRRSDREIAKALGVSQPTVSRTIAKLEKRGVIHEYAAIPDFKKIGYELMGVTFTRDAKPLSTEERQRQRKAVQEVEGKNPYASLVAVNGSGFGKDRMFIVLYRDYSRYAESMRLSKSLPNLAIDQFESFLVDLNDESSYRMFTLDRVARNLLAYGVNESTT